MRCCGSGYTPSVVVVIVALILGHRLMAVVGTRPAALTGRQELSVWVNAPLHGAPKRDVRPFTNTQGSPRERLDPRLLRI